LRAKKEFERSRQNFAGPLITRL